MLDRVAQIQTSTVSLEILAVCGSTFAPLHNVFAGKTIPIRESNIGSPRDVDRWPHLRDLRLLPANKGMVKLLIGQDDPELVLPRGCDSETLAIHTPHDHASLCILRFNVNVQNSLKGTRSIGH